jgi:flavin-dependent dehydrogenase
LKYDSFWLNMARKAGVEFRSGDKVISLDPAKNQVITANGHRYSGTCIWGADGAPSRLLKLLTAGGGIKNEKNQDWPVPWKLLIHAG